MVATGSTAIDQEIDRRRKATSRLATGDSWTASTGLLQGAGLEPVASAMPSSPRPRSACAGPGESRAATGSGRRPEPPHRGGGRAKRKVDEDAEAVNDELRSLQSRVNNLPSASLAAASPALLPTCGSTPTDLPFAGELIQVRTDATEWEGAAERVLHNFALSLLVPNRHYDAVATWINEHHLGGPARLLPGPGRHGGDRPPPDRHGGRPLLLDMLEIKPDTRFEAWLLDPSSAVGPTTHVSTRGRVPHPRPRRSPEPVRSRTGTATRRTTGAASTTAGSTCSAGATRQKIEATHRPRDRHPAPGLQTARQEMSEIGEKKRPAWSKSLLSLASL